VTISISEEPIDNLGQRGNSRRRTKNIHVGDFGGYDQAVISDQCLTCCADTSLTIRGQRYIRGPSVATVERPFCFSMADDKGARGSHRW